MNNANEEAERILMLVKQLKEGNADEELQMQVIENALKRAYIEGKDEGSRRLKRAKP